MKNKELSLLVSQIQSIASKIKNDSSLNTARSYLLKSAEEIVQASKKKIDKIAAMEEASARAKEKQKEWWELLKSNASKPQLNDKIADPKTENT